MTNFRALGNNRGTWSPAPLPLNVVLVTTTNPDGTPNVAPKSQFSVMAQEGPIVTVGCYKSHKTYANIVEKREFTVNMTTLDQADGVFSMLAADDRFVAAGLTTSAGKTVGSPYINECPAHFECELVDVVDLQGDQEEVIIVGRVKLAEVAEEFATDDKAANYAGMNLLYTLENGVTATLAPVNIHR